MRKSFSILFLGFVALAGCKSSTSPSSPSSNITMPNAGSYFVTASVETNSTGAIVSSDTTTDSFIQTGLNYDGKTNVDMIYETQAGVVTDTAYLHYESNGDLSVYSTGGASLFSGWITYPFASQGTNNINGDTVIMGENTQINLSLSGGGNGTSTIMGQSVAVEKVNLSGTITIPQVDTVQIGNSTTSFAPSLGYVVETASAATSVSNATHGYVIKYVIK
jgi:hypothetical protein